MAGKIICVLAAGAGEDEDDVDLIVRATDTKGVYRVSFKLNGKVVGSATGSKIELGVLGYHLCGAAMFGAPLDTHTGPYLTLDGVEY